MTLAALHNWGCGNGTDRSRTDDLLRVKQALYQLSYDPDTLCCNSLHQQVFTTAANLAQLWRLFRRTRVSICRPLTGSRELLKK